MLATDPADYGSNGEILYGEDPNRSVPAGIFGSFSDTPGGFSEEIKEIGIATGLEFSFKEKFAIIAGYNYQNPLKENSSY